MSCTHTVCSMSPSHPPTAPAGARPTYELQQVCKTYRRGDASAQALIGVDLVVAAGESVAVEGPVGAGRSTLLRLLGALDRPSSGTILLDGADLGRMGAPELSRVRANRIGSLSRSPNLIATLTAQEHVEAALESTHVDPRDRRNRVATVLEEVGLGELAAHLPSELTDGQQQRVALARALVREPAVLLADEPTGALDAVTRDGIVELLDTVRLARGLTLLIATDDPEVARRADRRLLLREGRLAERTAATV